MHSRLSRKDLGTLVSGALALGIGGCIIQTPPQQETSQSQNSSSESSPYVYNPPSSQSNPPNSEPPPASIDNPLGLTPINPIGNEVILYAVGDAYVDSLIPDANFGREKSFSTGLVNFGEGRDDDFLGYVQFDLDEIPRDAQIEDARLKLTTNNDASIVKPKGTVRVYRVEYECWNENSLNLNNAPNTGYYVTEKNIELENGTTYEFDVSSAVQEWVNGTANYGFLIMTRELDKPSYAAFYSRELDPDAGPRLYAHWR